MIKNVLMAHLDVARSPDILKTTLGSCIGIVLFDPDFEICGLAHIMLPFKGAQTTSDPARFADQGIESLLQRMKSAAQGRCSSFKAKIAGGARMFQEISFKNITAIGDQNIQAVRQILENLKIPILGEDLGGGKGRQLFVDVGEKKVRVSEIGGVLKEI